jgi:cytoskeletal protein CcmA (bactofilin family)
MIKLGGYYKIALLLAVSTLTACGGGGGGSSSSGNSVTSVGRIDGFGSVYVNGVEYDTSSASYRVDDEDAFDDSMLSVGMKVRIEGHVNSDGRTGVAYSIYYDDDLEGPIDNGSVVTNGNTKTFTVLGLAVSVDANTTVFHDGATFAGLTDGVEIEVSGFFDGNTLVASRVELQHDSNNDYEIKGTLTQYDSLSVTLELRNGAVAGPYAVSNSVRLEDLPANPVGSFVEIKLVNNGGTLTVVRIEGESDRLVHDGDHHVEIRGVVSGDAISGFSINGIPFEVSPTTRYEPRSLAGSITEGMMLKVEGSMSNGVLIAHKVEAKYKESEVKARVSSVNYTDGKNGSITLDLGNSQTITVNTDNSTSFESSSSDYGHGSSFLLSDLNSSDFVEVELAVRDSAFYALSVERESGSSSTEVEAIVENVSANSITVLGVTFSIDGSTSISGSPNVGNKVEIKDYNSDGTADRIEVKSSS